MANLYRFDGDRRQGWKTKSISIIDSDGVPRDVGRGSTVLLEDAVAEDLNDVYLITLATDAAPMSVTLEKMLVTSDIIDPLTGKIRTQFLPSSGPGASVVDASTTEKGVIRLAGDLSGSATNPSVPGLAAKQSASQVATAIAAHESDTTGVHGIADMLLLIPVLIHNGTAYPPRPAASTKCCLWIGPTDPGSAAQNNDLWIPTS